MRSVGSIVATVGFVVLAACGSDDEPAATDVPATDSPTTDSPTTGVPATDPPATGAPATDPPATDPPATDPPATDPPAPPDTGVVSPPADRPDACSLWTTGDLQAVTGLAFAEGVFNESLSVGGQEICDWIHDAAGIANAQVLLVTPALDYAMLRQGTDDSVGPAVDITIPGASAAATSADGAILIMDVDGIVIQVAYLPPGAPDATSAAQLVQLAEIAAANV